MIQCLSLKEYFKADLTKAKRDEQILKALKDGFIGSIVARYLWLSPPWISKIIKKSNLRIKELYNMKKIKIDWSETPAAVWRSNRKYLKPVSEVDIIDLDSLIGIDNQKKQICSNTELFLSSHQASHALLWGARGTGKSSIIKGLLNKYYRKGLRIIEIPKDGLKYLLDISDAIRKSQYRFIIFFDDLSFEEGDASYKALKSTLEGTIEAPAKNILIYATSNRRHLLPHKMRDNLEQIVSEGEIHQNDAIEEKMSIVDRFGLVLSFYAVNQETFLKMVDSYFPKFNGNREILHQEAIRYAAKKGIRSGRVAKQFRNYFQIKTTEPHFAKPNLKEK